MIACLGWGSLIWDPQSLPVNPIWFADGPLLPIEFARISDDKRLTLVYKEGVSDVRVLWAPFTISDLNKARESLRLREKCGQQYISSWSPEASSDDCPATIVKWATQLNLRGVVWTALPPRLEKSGDDGPSCEQAIQHLRGLTGNQLQNARRYIDKAPLQINTAYRRRIEAELNWRSDSV